MLGSEVPITADYETQWGLWLGETDGGQLESQILLFKGPYTDLPRLICSELGQQLNRCSKNLRGGTELSGFRTRAGRATFSQTEGRAETIVTFLSPPPQNQEGGTTSESPSTWLKLLAPP